MCKCNKGAAGTCSCGSSSLKEVFEKNELAIAEVFKKYDAGHLPVTPIFASSLATIIGEDFENDLGEIIFPDDFSDADGGGEKKPKRKGRIKKFFKGMGDAVKGMVGANGAEAVAQIGSTIAGNEAAAVAAKQECAEGFQLDEKKGICVKKPTILGLTYAQAGLIGLVIVGVVVLVVMSNKKGGNK